MNLPVVSEDELLEKYGRLKENYREFARRQLDFLLELQEKEEKMLESPVDQTTSPMIQLACSDKI